MVEAQVRGSIWASWLLRFRRRRKIRRSMGWIKRMLERIKVPQKYRIWANLNLRRIPDGWTRGSLRSRMWGRWQPRMQVCWRSRARICRRSGRCRGAGSVCSAVGIRAVRMAGEEVGWARRAQLGALWSGSQARTAGWPRNRWCLALQQRQRPRKAQKRSTQKKRSNQPRRISCKHSL